MTSVVRIKGHGEYTPVQTGQKQPGVVNRLARAAGEALGSAIPLIPGIGKLIPAPLISAASSALGDAGSWLARAFGFGRYDVRKNSLMALRPGRRSVEQASYVASPPVFGTTQKGSDIIFAHREYIGDVKSSVQFKSTTYPINPGNPVMFPWLSKVASLYEEYEMLGLLFEYRSTSATAVGTTSSGMGVVVMATDYDCYDSAFTSKRQMEAAEYSSAAVPYETFLHPVECDRRRNVMAQEYVVPGITDYTQASGDARMSVLGNFTIATEGQQADNNVIGELWVTYHVRLSRPVLEPTPTPLTYAQEISWITSGLYDASDIVSKASIGPGLTPTFSSMGTTSRCIVLSNSLAKLRGRYMFSLIQQASGTITGTTQNTSNDVVLSGGAAKYTGTISNASALADFGTATIQPGTGGQIFSCCFTAFVNLTGDDAIITVPFRNAAGSGIYTISNLIISPFNVDGISTVPTLAAPTPREAGSSTDECDTQTPMTEEELDQRRAKAFLLLKNSSESSELQLAARQAGISLTDLLTDTKWITAKK